MTKVALDFSLIRQLIFKTERERERINKEKTCIFSFVPPPRLRHVCRSGHAQKPIPLSQWERTEADADVLYGVVRETAGCRTAPRRQELSSPVGTKTQTRHNVIITNSHQSSRIFVGTKPKPYPDCPHRQQIFIHSFIFSIHPLYYGQWIRGQSWEQGVSSGYTLIGLQSITALHRHLRTRT